MLFRSISGSDHPYTTTLPSRCLRYHTPYVWRARRTRARSVQPCRGTGFDTPRRVAVEVPNARSHRRRSNAADEAENERLVAGILNDAYFCCCPVSRSTQPKTSNSRTGSSCLRRPRRSQRPSPSLTSPIRVRCYRFFSSPRLLG